MAPMDQRKHKKKRMLNNIPILKMKLTTSKNFSEVVDYFFDEFGDEPLFLDISKPYPKPELLLQIIAHSIGAALGIRKVVVRKSIFVHVIDYPSFVHGTYCFNDRMASFFYFDDICTGMLSMLSSDGQHSAGIIRITGYPMNSIPPSQKN